MGEETISPTSYYSSPLKRRSSRSDTIVAKLRWLTQPKGSKDDCILLKKAKSFTKRKKQDVEKKYKKKKAGGKNLPLCDPLEKARLFGREESDVALLKDQQAKNKPQRNIIKAGKIEKGPKGKEKKAKLNSDKENKKIQSIPLEEKRIKGSETVENAFQKENTKVSDEFKKRTLKLWGPHSKALKKLERFKEAAYAKNKAKKKKDKCPQNSPQIADLKETNCHVQRISDEIGKKCTKRDIEHIKAAGAVGSKVIAVKKASSYKNLSTAVKDLCHWCIPYAHYFDHSLASEKAHLMEIAYDNFAKDLYLRSKILFQTKMALKLCKEDELKQTALRDAKFVNESIKPLMHRPVNAFLNKDISDEYLNWNPAAHSQDWISREFVLNSEAILRCAASMKQMEELQAALSNRNSASESHLKSQATSIRDGVAEVLLQCPPSILHNGLTPKIYWE